MWKPNILSPPRKTLTLDVFWKWRLFRSLLNLHLIDESLSYQQGVGIVASGQVSKRFWLAVDGHCKQLPIFSDCYFSLMVQRWLLHFQDFCQGSSQSSFALYRERGRTILVLPWFSFSLTVTLCFMEFMEFALWLSVHL